MIYEIKDNNTLMVMKSFKTNDYYDYVSMDAYTIEKNREVMFTFKPMQLDYDGVCYKFVSMGIFGGITCIYIDEIILKGGF